MHAPKSEKYRHVKQMYGRRYQYIDRRQHETWSQVPKTRSQGQIVWSQAVKKAITGMEFWCQGNLEKKPKAQIAADLHSSYGKIPSLTLPSGDSGDAGPKV